MRIRSWLPCFAVAGVSLWPIGSFAACSLGLIAELPVRMDGLRAYVPVKLNGVESQLVLDSGAFYSMLSPGTAATLKLKLSSASGYTVKGVNGTAGVAVGTIDKFVLGNIALSGKYQFLVGGTDPGGGAAGLLGDNVLSVADAEYDLSHGVVRLMKPVGCGDAPLAYWAAAAQLPVESMAIDPSFERQGHIIGTVKLNGQDVRVVFDTGFPLSVLTLAAAKRAGVTPQSPGVTSAGMGFGLGRGFYPTWVGPFANFKIGGQEVLNTRIRFGDLDLGFENMVLGMDFFLSHHIYVANSQHKLYFTYNGGPVFNLASLSSQPSAAPSPDTADEPHSAADFAARGRALLARHEFERAIADLTQAAQLDPSQPDYFYQRAIAYLGERQGEPARADLDQALKLKPDFTDALLSRTRMEIAKPDMAAARSDLDAADRALAQESDLRLEMSDLYLNAEAPEQAVHQVDLWIAIHGEDARLPRALNIRCWTRVLWNHDLDKAEADCKRALRLSSNAPGILDSLGWVQLRQGRFDRSIDQFKAALQKQPKMASSLYGRGIAELRLGKTPVGEADIAAANALEPKLAENMRRWGLTP